MENNKTIRVLIVNDSLMVRETLRRIVLIDSGMSVAGFAVDGEEGIRLARELKPDVILMDIRMPKVDGATAVREIMTSCPCPILMVTATIQAHRSYIYDALLYGALDVIKTPKMEGKELTAEARNLLHKIRVVAGLKHRPWKAIVKKTENASFPLPSPMPGKPARRLVVIGASTGGPPTLLAILKSLPKNFPFAVVIVQHIGAEFAPGLAEWFRSNTSLPVSGAVEGAALLEGEVLVAVEDKHLAVTRDGRVHYEEPEASAIHIPSIDVTFHSAARAFGKSATGVLLTGMGADGAAGLKSIQEAGGRTIAQDEATSIIYGMPKAAADRNAAEFILPLNLISSKIMELAGG